VNFFAPFIRRPIGTSLLAAGLTIAGFLAYLLLGVAALPAVEVPAVFVQVQLPGANAQTMATTVIAPLERHFGRIPGVDQMYSNSSEGSGFVRIRFTMDRTTDAAARDVQAAINASAADLPPGMPSPPQYFKFDTGQIPVMLVALTSKSMPPDKLFDLVDTQIRPSIYDMKIKMRRRSCATSSHSTRAPRVRAR